MLSKKTTQGYGFGFKIEINKQKKKNKDYEIKGQRKKACKIKNTEIKDPTHIPTLLYYNIKFQTVQ